MIKFLWNRAEELERTRILLYLRNEAARYHSLMVIREAEIKARQKPAMFRGGSPKEYRTVYNAIMDIVRTIEPPTTSPDKEQKETA